MNNYARIKNYSHVIIDYDRTLMWIDVDWSIWRKAYKDLLYTYDKTINLDSPQLTKQQNMFIEKFGQKFRNDLCAMNEAFELTYEKGGKRNEEFIKMLNVHKDTLKYSIFISQSRKLFTLMQQRYPLPFTIETVVTRDDVHYIKPNPEGVHTIVSPGKDLDTYIYFGDSESDELAANAAGIDFEYVKMSI